MLQLTAQRQNLFRDTMFFTSTSHIRLGHLADDDRLGQQDIRAHGLGWCSQGTRMSRSIFTFRYS